MEQHSNHNPDFQSAETVANWQNTPAELTDKSRHERRFQNGAIWMCVGALLLVLSFGINLVLFQKMDFTTLMYVMVTVGALCVLKGMGNIFN